MSLPIISFNTQRYEEGEITFHYQKCNSCGKQTEILCRYGVEKDVACIFCKEPLILVRWTNLNKQEVAEVQMLSQEIIDELEKKNIKFTTMMAVGQCDIPPAEINDYLKNPDAYEAKRFDVSLDILKAYKKHIENPRCHALTRNGKPCKGFVEQVRAIKDYHPEISNYCLTHKQFGLTRGKISKTKN